ncbi:protein TOO MANY MOUTHS [Mercurialis annua]|uniref:protein TOO MANY MOUTHS n=1 Tax=Mercurialis annua TaxID=3986 RepID=UPI00215EB120|nr:protein TOO MANY MOUTHS [Mercurialis annua]
MSNFFYTRSLLLQLVLISFLLPLTKSFVVIVSDSSNQSALVDGLRNGFSTGARTDAHEQAAVYDIMKATGNDWATDIPDVCRGRWHGIECMLDKDNVYHVVSLSFGALSDDTAFPTCDPIKSYISYSITKLPHIRTLFFYRCLRYNPQPIPSFLGQLGPTLQSLVLRENGHLGTIPDELGNLTRLKVLDLHRNNLNGSIPVSLGRLAGLRSLDLSGNKLTGSIPSLNFPVLNVMDLNRNYLTGSIPFSLGSCHSLIKMDISHNRLTGSIPDSFSGLKELTLMDLSYNRLSKPLPISIKSLNSLQAFILEGNPMSITLASDEFDGMKGLMILILSHMNLQGPIPDSLGRLINLRVIHLNGNRFNGSIPTNFRNLKNLSELKLNDNQLSGSVPFGREMVWKMRRKLKLQNNIGLCYDANNGFEDGFDTASGSGIGLCRIPKPGSSRTVQHLSAMDREMPSIVSKSSGEVSSIIRLLHQSIAVVLFLLLL